jgi:hypothetical protein
MFVSRFTNSPNYVGCPAGCLQLQGYNSALELTHSHVEVAHPDSNPDPNPSCRQILYSCRHQPFPLQEQWHARARDRARARARVRARNRDRARARAGQLPFQNENQQSLYSMNCDVNIITCMTPLTWLEPSILPMVRARRVLPDPGGP